MTDEIDIIVQARMNSSRLPGKVMKFFRRQNCIRSCN